MPVRTSPQPCSLRACPGPRKPGVCPSVCASGQMASVASLCLSSQISLAPGSACGRHATHACNTGLPSLPTTTSTAFPSKRGRRSARLGAQVRRCCVATTSQSAPCALAQTLLFPRPHRGFPAVINPSATTGAASTQQERKWQVDWAPTSVLCTCGQADRLLPVSPSVSGPPSPCLAY